MEDGSELNLAFTETTWSGLPAYKCAQCSLIFTDIDRAYEHFESTHLPKPVVRKWSGLVGPDGNTPLIGEV